MKKLKSINQIEDLSTEDKFYNKFLELGGVLDRESYDYYRKCMESILDRWVGGYSPVCDRDFTWNCFVHVCDSNFVYDKNFTEDVQEPYNLKSCYQLAELIFKSVDSVEAFS